MHISNNAYRDYRRIDIDACICTRTLYMHTAIYQYAYSPTFFDVGLGQPLCNKYYCYGDPTDFIFSNINIHQRGGG